MKRRTSLTLTLTSVLVAMLAFVPQASAQVDPGEPGDPGYYICHATGAEGQWVMNDPDNAGDAAGHIGASHQDGRDIVPPFTAPDGSTMSQNWNAETAAIYYNKCQPLPENTPTATDVPPTATATDVPPTATATDVPPTATATDVPPTATATDVPATATATATTVPGQPSPTDVPPTATTVPPEPTDVPKEPEPTKAPASVTTLPSTGSDGGSSGGGQTLILLTAAAATLMAGAGALLANQSRTRQER